MPRDPAHLLEAEFCLAACPGPKLSRGPRATLCFTGTFKTCRKESGLRTPCRVGSKPHVCDVALAEFSARARTPRREPPAASVSASGSSTWSRGRTWAACRAADPERAGCEGPLRAPVSPGGGTDAPQPPRSGLRSWERAASTPRYWVPRRSSDACADARAALPIFPSCSRRFEAAMRPCHLPAAVPVDGGRFPPLPSIIRAA